jgi:hypothetical protein
VLKQVVIKMTKDMSFPLLDLSRREESLFIKNDPHWLKAKLLLCINLVAITNEAHRV